MQVLNFQIYLCCPSWPSPRQLLLVISNLNINENYLSLISFNSPKNFKTITMAIWWCNSRQGTRSMEQHFSGSAWRYGVWDKRTAPSSSCIIYPQQWIQNCHGAANPGTGMLLAQNNVMCFHLIYLIVWPKSVIGRLFSLEPKHYYFLVSYHIFCAWWNILLIYTRIIIKSMHYLLQPVTLLRFFKLVVCVAYDIK